ncbi:hypothetical protein BLNAU_24932 [Blattamonas nauphoetae]|uniref:Uncharacterized protein n=1 Tax=Blattamonas nauphoetae TaxID=2049346 RepID=A0ABQ9WL20_9EUKA|nr:hypothetical protein BLNAU_24932 [Blattamonas nauphoetae]
MNSTEAEQEAAHMNQLHSTSEANETLQHLPKDVEQAGMDGLRWRAPEVVADGGSAVDGHKAANEEFVALIHRCVSANPNHRLILTDLEEFLSSHPDDTRIASEKELNKKLRWKSKQKVESIMLAEESESQRSLSNHQTAIRETRVPTNHNRNTVRTLNKHPTHPTTTTLPIHKSKTVDEGNERAKTHDESETRGVGEERANEIVGPDAIPVAENTRHFENTHSDTDTTPCPEILEDSVDFTQPGGLN